MSRRDPIACDMVIYKKEKRGRKDLVATGERARRCKKSLSNAAKEREPWLLATSLSSNETSFTKRVVKIYKSRMQIEESFSDLKTGFNFNQSNSRKQKRIEVLLLISIIAQFVLFLLGVAVKLLGKHLRYQVNSIKERNVLCYQYIGLRVLKDRHLKLNEYDITLAFERIKTLIVQINIA